MKLKPLSRTAASASALLAVMSAGLPLSASAMDDHYHSAPGFNLGGGIGANSIHGENFSNSGNNVDATQVAFKGFAGVRVNDFLSFEAQYIDFGTAENGNDHVKAHGITAGAMLEAPIWRFVRPYGKAGALSWNADGSFSGVNRDDHGTDFTYGAGVRFLLSERVNARAEYERFDFNENRVNTVSAMLQFNF